MDAIQIFQELIGVRITPLILQYEPYKDIFITHPYHHSLSSSFEEDFVNLMFDNIVFYAYEKEEIEKEYKRSKLSILRKVARNAYERRVPKTERSTDGLLGELTLDSFIKCFFKNIQMLYSRVKYLERYPKKDLPTKPTGHEVKGYDGLLFSVENGKKYIWVGQVKTGSWDYCLTGIKSDISKSILKNYFSGSMIIMADIMRAASNISDELQQIIDDLNDICLEYPKDTEKLYTETCNYFIKNNITIRIPCLIIAEEEKYEDKDLLLEIIKTKCHKAFKEYAHNSSNLNIEVLLLIFPVRDLKKIRNNFLTLRINHDENESTSSQSVISN